MLQLIGNSARNTTRLLLFATLLTCAAFTSDAQDQDLPSGEELMDAYVKAVGSSETHKEHKNSKMTGTMAMMGMKGKMTVYAARPNKFFTSIEIEGIGEIKRGFAEDVAWESSMMGPRIIEGAERDIMMIQDADFDSQMDWKRQFTDVKCVGLETIEDKEYYQLKMNLKNVGPATMLLTKKTSLPHSMKFVAPTAMGDIPMETLFAEYKTFDGITSPVRIIQKAASMEIVIQFSETKYNVEIPEGTFDLPEEIKLLLEQKAAEPESDPKPVGVTAPTE